MSYCKLDDIGLERSHASASLGDRVPVAEIVFPQTKTSSKGVCFLKNFVVEDSMLCFGSCQSESEMMMLLELETIERNVVLPKSERLLEGYLFLPKVLCYGFMRF